MGKVAIVTDSNSGITQNEAKELGIFVVPMPFYIDEKLYYEDIDLTQEQFYVELEKDADIKTSQPAPTDVTDLWDDVLKEYDEIIHIPMSSGLSGSCQTAMMLAEDYDGKVYVINNQRISITQKMSVLEAAYLVDEGKSAKEIADILMEYKMESSIYITLETLKYLKKGGRITPAAAALGTILKIKPVLQIQGEKLDAFTKVRSLKQAKKVMLDAVVSDSKERFGSEDNLDGVCLMMAYSGTKDEILEFQKEVHELYPDKIVIIDPLSLSVACHIGAGAVAIAVTKKLPMVDYEKMSERLKK